VAATISGQLPRLLVLAGLGSLCVLLGLLAGADPALGLQATVAAAFVLVTIVNLTAGVVLYMLIAFFEPGALVGPLIAAAVLLAISWFARVSTTSGSQTRTLAADHPTAIYALALLIAWGVVSFNWAEQTGDAVQDLARYLINFGLFVIVYTAAHTRREVAWLIGGFVLGAAATSVYGLVVQPEVGLPAEAFRFSGGLGDPNVLAAVLIAGVALAAGGAAAMRRYPLVRLGCAAAAGLCLFALLLTASRGGLIALGLTLLAAPFVMGRWRLHALLGGTVIAVSVVLYFMLFASDDAREHVERATSGELRSQESRLTIWQIGWRMVEANPVQGVGLGNFQAASIHYVLQPGQTPRTDRIVDTPMGAHNTYLHLFSELGVVGGVLFLAIVGFALRSALLAARNFGRAGDLAMELMSRAVVVATIGLLAASFFISMQSNNKFWLVLGLGPGLLAVSRSVAPAEGDDAPLAATAR